VRAQQQFGADRASAAVGRFEYRPVLAANANGVDALAARLRERHAQLVSLCSVAKHPSQVYLRFNYDSSHRTVSRNSYSEVIVGNMKIISRAPVTTTNAHKASRGYATVTYTGDLRTIGFRCDGSAGSLN
jgi:hypothetical protein